MTQQVPMWLTHVDWHDMPTDPICPDWGLQRGGHLGPCHTCAACWLAANHHALKRLAALAQAQAGGES